MLGKDTIYITLAGLRGTKWDKQQINNTVRWWIRSKN